MPCTCFEATVIRGDDSLTVWVTASVTPRLAFDSLDDYWESDTATINDCTDHSGNTIPLHQVEERDLEYQAIEHFYAQCSDDREAIYVAREDHKHQSTCKSLTLTHLIF